MNERRACALHYALGTIEECPGAACPFWEPGGAAIEPRCAFERLGLELETRPGIAEWLLEIRTSLERAATTDDRTRSILPPGLRD